jgi:CubicO group peptidase (beta-lactamase class C family)
MEIPSQNRQPQFVICPAIHLNMKITLRFLTFSFLLLTFVWSPAQKTKPTKAGAKPPISIGSLSTDSYNTFLPTGFAVAVVKDGELLYASGFGKRSAANGPAVEASSLFNIASCSKAFTAAALAALVEDGKIKWDDKVIDYLPGFRLEDPWITAQITLRDLLCHRSGLATFYGDLLWYGTTYTDEEILARMRHIHLLNDFRSEFGYQNNMYMVAGMVIQKVTGKTWEQFVTDRFFRPLGMDNTRSSNDALTPGQNIAFGHINGKQQEIFDFNGTKPAASIYSSVEDLSKWCRMWLAGGTFNGKQILSKESIRTIQTVHMPLGVSPNSESWGIHFRGYGLGWNLFDYAGRKIVEHDGGMPGYVSKVTLVPEEKLGIVVLNSGMDFFINDALRFKLLDHLLRHEGRNWDALFMSFKQGSDAYAKQQESVRNAARISNTKPGLPLSAYTGTYDDPAYGKAQVTEQDGGLHLSFLPAKAIFSGAMSHWHFDTFKVQFKDDFLTFGLVGFEVGPDGKVKGFKIDLPSDDFQFFELDFKKEG